MNYGEYLKSSRWRAVKARYMASNLPKDCYVCGTPDPVRREFHHRTYKNLGHERLMDIVPVCFECHTLVHELAQTLGLDLWRATKRARKVARHR